MSQENVGLFKEYIERFNRGDVAGALRYGHPEIRFEHRLVELQGEVTGIDAVRDWFVDASNLFDRWTVDCDDFRDLRIRLDLDQIGHLPLGGGWFGRDFKGRQTLIGSGHAPESGVRFVRPGFRRADGSVFCGDAVSFDRLPTSLSALASPSWCCWP